MNGLRPSFSALFRLFFIVVMFGGSIFVHAETVTPKDDSDVDDNSLLETLLGNRLTVSSIEVVGNNAQFGLFAGYEFLFGSEFTSGVLISTGEVDSVIEDVNSNDEASGIFNFNPVDDPDLGDGIYDPAKITLTFIPEFNSVILDFIFGSEEYNEHVHSDHNDNFVILVNGENCAKTPDGLVFSIDTVNDRAQYPPVYGEPGPSSNSHLYISNDPGADVEGDRSEVAHAPYATEMDGFTKQLRCLASVEPNVENTILIGIVDEGDPIYDSWVFLRTHSFTSTVYRPDFDADQDGIPDFVEGKFDTDRDGIDDYLDTDSDNDGIPDRLEDRNTPQLTGLDHDNDWIDDAIDVDVTGGADANNNGIDDAFEPTDTDNDGLPDYRDLDSDDDGIPDHIELGQIPSRTGLDSDSDGIDNAYDVDQTDGRDTNGNGFDDAFEPLDTDSDGTPNAYDLDSDNDGIADRAEGLASLIDSNANGIDDSYDVLITGGSDADQNGIDDAVTPNDYDQDGIANYLDLDSDNDGLTDVSESGLIDADLDNNGIVDNGQLTFNPLNTDLAGNPDFIEIDSDGDGNNDIIGTPGNEYDNDNDGQIDDEFAGDSDGDGVPDIIDPDDSVHGLDADSDLDGVLNSIDLDTDNDGIPNSIEAPNGVDRDSDGDGIVDRLDLDSDNDGIPDSIEFTGNANVDKNRDGLLDNKLDANQDGLSDIVNVNAIAIDTDGDNTPDYLDTDSDNDGVSDLKESMPTGFSPDLFDTDNNGRIDSTVDLDLDGLMDVVDSVIKNGTPGTSLSLIDIDKDGLPAYRDLDTDGDGFTDSIEDGDYNDDGITDRQQKLEALKTAVSGVGVGSLGLEYLLLLPLLLVFRKKKITNQLI